MAKAPYKKEADKKDKALRFRISNQLYDLLKKLSKNNNQSVNLFARNLLMDHIYSRYPQNEEVLKDLREKKKILEAEFKAIGSEKDEPDWDKLYEEKLIEARDIKNKRDRIRSEILHKLEEIEQVDLMIKRYEEIKSGVSKSKVREYHYFEEAFPDDIEMRDDFQDIESDIREGEGD